MPTIEFEKVKLLATIATYSKKTYELCLVKWNNGSIKYDLRKWGDDGKTPYRGITFTETELRNVYQLLKDYKFTQLDQYEKKYQKGDVVAYIYEVLGEFKSSGKMKGYVTYTGWSGSPKIDIRHWTDDFTTCSKGITLSKSEMKNLITYLKSEFELKIEEVKEDNETNDVLDSLFL